MQMQIHPEKPSSLCCVCGEYVQRIVHSSRIFVHLAAGDPGPAPDTSFVAICPHGRTGLEAWGFTGQCLSELDWRPHRQPEIFARWVEHVALGAKG